MKLGLLGYTPGSIFNRTAKIGIKKLEQTTLGLSADRTLTSTITRQYGVYRPEDNSTKQYYKGDIQSFYYIGGINGSPGAAYEFTDKPQGLDDRPDGSRFLYIVNGGGDVFGTLDDVDELSLITSESLKEGVTATTRRLHWRDNSLVTRFPNLQAMRFKSDGTKLYGIGTLRSQPSGGSSTYYGSCMFMYPISPTFTLSSSFLISSLTFPEVYYFNGATSYTSAQVGLYGVDDPYDTRGLSPNGYRIKESFINPDGLIFYYLIGNIIYQGSLLSGWSLSNVSLNQSSLDVGDSTINTFTFNSNGTKLFTLASSNDRMQQYNLGTPWQISTASLTSILDLSMSGGGANFLRIGIRMLSSQSTIMCLSRYNNYASSTSPTSISFFDEIRQALY